MNLPLFSSSTGSYVASNGLLRLVQYPDNATGLPSTQATDEETAPVDDPDAVRRTVTKW